MIDLIINDNNNLDIVETISELNPYMYLEKTKNLSQKQPNVFDLNIKTDIETNVEETSIDKDLFHPTQKDTLFWCVFIAAHGYNEYLQVNRNYGAKEIEIKENISNILNNNKKSFKACNYKITQIKIKEIVSDFLTTIKDTNIDCLIALSVYYKINFYIIHKSNKYMIKIDANPEENYPTYLLYCDSFNKYSIDINELTSKDITNLYDKYVYIDNYLKPVKSIVNYKVDDLINIASKLKIYDKTKKYKKQELYELIYNFIKW
jgi:hypothetical protein